MKRAIAALAFCGALGVAVAAHAGAPFLPAIVYEDGGKADKYRNEAASRGAQRFQSKTGIAVREFEITNETQRAQAFANMARRGATIIVGVGFTQRAALETVARQYPDKKFTLIDTTSDLPNVQSVVFREQEGSFLVGVLAALVSKSHTLGFVGGIDIPLLHAFSPVYSAGPPCPAPPVAILLDPTLTPPP